MLTDVRRRLWDRGEGFENMQGQGPSGFLDKSPKDGLPVIFSQFARGRRLFARNLKIEMLSFSQVGTDLARPIRW